MYNLYNRNINKLTSSSIFEKFEQEVLHVCVTEGDKVSRIDSKLILLDRFLGLVNVLVSIHLLLPEGISIEIYIKKLYKIVFNT